MADEWMTTEQAAARLGLSVPQVRYLITRAKRNRLPASRFGADERGPWMIHRDDLQAFIEAREAEREDDERGPGRPPKETPDG